MLKKIKQAAHLLHTTAAIQDKATPMEPTTNPLLLAMYFRQDILQNTCQLDQGANVNCTNNENHLHDYRPIKSYSINMSVIVDSWIQLVLGISISHVEVEKS